MSGNRKPKKLSRPNHQETEKSTPKRIPYISEMEPCYFQPKIKNKITHTKKTQKKFLIFSQKKTFLTFQEKVTRKKFFIFQEMETPKKFLIFQEIQLSNFLNV